MLELQAGTAHIISSIGNEDFAVVEADPTLWLLPYVNPNIFYIGFTNTFEPWDDVNVRKAVALGIDRQRIIDNFWPEGSEVASHFTPCTVMHGCDGEAWYDFDAAAGKALLAEAGFPNGFDTTIYYRDVVRNYLPTPGLVAVELQTQLKENLGINAEVVILNILKDLQQEFDLTYLFVAHNLAVVEHISDEVAVMYLGRIIEKASREELFKRPLHPYTQALISAIPAAHPKQKKERIILKGDVPSALNPPPGCHFHPRCPIARPDCSEIDPSLEELYPGHLLACRYTGV